MFLVWQRTCFARAEKHIFSEQVTDTVLDEAAVKADLSMLSLLSKVCMINLTNVRHLRKKLCCLAGFK